MKCKNKLSLSLMVGMCLICLSRTCKYLKAGVPKVLCDCDSFYGSREWSYTCFIAKDSFEMLFTVEYKISEDDTRSVTFECGADETDFERILKQINHTNVQRYTFRSCPLPNASYGGLFHELENYTPLRVVEIENTRDNRSFTADLFVPLSDSLEMLILNRNGIRELPESIFVNFSKLQFLFLSDLSLKSLPEKIFHPLSYLSRLEILNTQLESLPENIFDQLFNLEYLYLYQNKLRELPNTIFRSLMNLRALDISQNQLLSIPPDIFMGLSQITSIRLIYNRLRTLPKELFSYTLNIREISLTMNSFVEPLPETLLQGLTRLERFSIEECNVSSLHETFFRYSPNVANLNLKNNRLKELPEKIFINNTMLKELDLGFNFIEVLQETLLENQKYLEKLSLYHNNITIIPENFFKNTRHIKTLNLGRNNIHHFRTEMFRDLPNLESIDLRGNKLTSFMLHLNREIKYIFLSHNNISNEPLLHYINHVRLEILDLQYNKIKHFTIPNVYINDKRTSINVAHNNIANVDVSDILLIEEHLSKLSSTSHTKDGETSVSLNSNPFVCDCKLYPFFEYLTRYTDAPKKTVKFSMIHDLICNEPQIFRNKPLLKMKPEEFTCELKENCSSPCRCYYRVHDDSTIVNCSNHQLRELPRHIPSNTSILYFNNNSLTSIAAFNAAKWGNLTDVFLDDNQISNINDWNIPSNMKSISLKGNRLRQLPESFLNLTYVKDEFRVNLSSNPWTCSCSTANFKTWLAHNLRSVPDANDVLCSQRFKVNRVSVLTIADNIMCPANDWPYKVTTLATAWSVLALFVAVLLYHLLHK